MPRELEVEVCNSIWIHGGANKATILNDCKSSGCCNDILDVNRAISKLLFLNKVYSVDNKYYLIEEE